MKRTGRRDDPDAGTETVVHSVAAWDSAMAAQVLVGPYIPAMLFLLDGRVLAVELGNHRIRMLSADLLRATARGGTGTALWHRRSSNALAVSRCCLMGACWWRTAATSAFAC